MSNSWCSAAIRVKVRVHGCDGTALFSRSVQEKEKNKQSNEPSPSVKIINENSLYLNLLIFSNLELLIYCVTLQAHF